MTGEPPLTLSCAALRACDRVAIEQFGIPGVVLMENAGRGAAEAIGARLHAINPDWSQTRVLIAAGTGNNGGDGFVVARHLAGMAVGVDIVVCGGREKIGGDALVNLRIVEAMGLPIRFFTAELTDALAAALAPSTARCDLIVDALLGTGQSGPPREPFATAIETINRTGRPVIALDIPSGLDGDSGQPCPATIRAGQTLTFAALKPGFSRPEARAHTGEITVCPIGIPIATLLAHLNRRD